MNGFGSSSAALEPPIFVIDPDVGQRSFIDRVLGRGGFRTTTMARGEEALEAAEVEQPHLVVVEVRLEDISGYEVCCALKERFGDTVGVMFTSRDRNEPSDRAVGFMLGADDYLDKPLVGEELLARVRRLATRLHATRVIDADDRSDLTPRELEILQLLAAGLDQNAIAESLVISSKTVAKHIEHILQKLPARSRAEAVAIAYQRGLTRPD